MIVGGGNKMTLIRRYVYHETYEEVKKWAKENKVFNNQNQQPFPYILSLYLIYLKYEKNKE